MATTVLPTYKIIYTCNDFANQHMFDATLESGKPRVKTITSSQTKPAAFTVTNAAGFSDLGKIKQIRFRHYHSTTYNTNYNFTCTISNSGIKTNLSNVTSNTITKKLDNGTIIENVWDNIEGFNNSGWSIDLSIVASATHSTSYDIYWRSNSTVPMQLIIEYYTVADAQTLLNAPYIDQTVSDDRLGSFSFSPAYNGKNKLTFTPSTAQTYIQYDDEANLRGVTMTHSLELFNPTFTTSYWSSGILTFNPAISNSITMTNILVPLAETQDVPFCCRYTLSDSLGRTATRNLTTQRKLLRYKRPVISNLSTTRIAYDAESGKYVPNGYGSYVNISFSVTDYGYPAVQTIRVQTKDGYYTDIAINGTSISHNWTNHVFGSTTYEASIYYYNTIENFTEVYGDVLIPRQTAPILNIEKGGIAIGMNCSSTSGPPSVFEVAKDITTDIQGSIFCGGILQVSGLADEGEQVTRIFGPQEYNGNGNWINFVGDVDFTDANVTGLDTGSSLPSGAIIPMGFTTAQVSVNVSTSAASGTTTVPEIAGAKAYQILGVLGLSRYGVPSANRLEAAYIDSNRTLHATIYPTSTGSHDTNTLFLVMGYITV